MKTFSHPPSIIYYSSTTLFYPLPTIKFGPFSYCPEKQQKQKKKRKKKDTKRRSGAVCVTSEESEQVEKQEIKLC